MLLNGQGTMASADSASLKQQLDDICECPICSGVMDDPRSLPCLHTYCLKCITEFGADKRAGDQLSCPFCRKEFTMPESGFGELPKNFFINKLIQIKMLSNVSADRVSPCDVCSSNEADPTRRNPATVWCTDCQQKFCDGCNSLHAQMSISRLHRSFRVGFDNSSGDAMSRFADATCAKHPGNSLKMYCFPCGVAICKTCFSEFHQPHRCSDISKIAGEFKQLLANCAKTLAHSVEKNRRFLTVATEATTAFNDAVATVEAQMCEKTEELIRLIEKQKQELLNEVEVIKRERKKREDHETSELQNHISMTDSLMKYTDELVKKGTDCDIVREKSGLLRKAEELLNLDFGHIVNNIGCMNLTFEGTSELLDVNSNMVGKVHVETKVVSFCSPTAVNLVGTVRSSNSGGFVAGVASLGNHLFIVRQHGRYIEVFDAMTYTFLHQLDVLGFKVDYISRLLACAAHSCLYISQWDKMAIYRVDLAHNNEVISWKVKSNPKAISISKAANLLVVCRGKPDVLEEYTTGGSLVRQIQLQTIRTHHAVELDDGRFVCCQGSEDDEPHRVCILTADGQVVYSYGNERGSAKGLLNVPVFMAVDRRGFIFVANFSDNRIVVLNPLLSWVRDLTVDDKEHEIVFLAMCSVDSRDRLFVGDVDASRIFVFDDLETI